MFLGPYIDVCGGSSVTRMCVVGLLCYTGLPFLCDTVGLARQML